jgi:phosphohistidine phosphatase
LKLAIVRHGKAEDRAPSGEDRDRALTSRGKRQADWIGERLASLFTPPDVTERLVITSDYARALATARAIERAVGCLLWKEERLQVGHDASAAALLLMHHAHVQGLIMVGHNPQLSGLLSLLAPRSAAADTLQTGEAAILTVDPGRPAGSGKILDRLRLDE